MQNAATTITREIAMLRQFLKAMDRSLRRLGPKLGRAVHLGGKSGQEGLRRRLKLSPKRRAQLKIQGKYMATIRQLGPKQKAEVRSLMLKKGMPAAVARAQRLMKRETAA